jgi:hypothetical protein
MNCNSGKSVYPSPQSAWRAVQMLQSTSNHSSRHRSKVVWAKTKLEGYKCPYCKQWHVGHGVIRE